MTMSQISVVWGGWKMAIETFLGLSADAVHVHVGVLLFIFFALITRKRVYHWMPWFLVLLVEGVNEFIDMNQPVGSPESNWPDSRHDILNTMFLPTVLVLLLRWRNQSLWLRPVPHD